MPLYHKTYRTFKKERLKGTKRSDILSIMPFIGILIVDSIFFVFRVIHKLLFLIAINGWPALRFTARLIFRLIILPSYGLILAFNRSQRTFFAANKNKLLFLFTNRYVSHTVAVLIVLITITQNISIRKLRAEDIGTNSILPDFAPGQIPIEEIIEEKIVIPKQGANAVGNKTPGMDLPPAIAPPAFQNAPEAEPPSVILSQDGTVITKPEFSETFDTPKPRESVITYEVESQDTIYDIAEKFNVSVNTILWANKLSARSVIRPGDELKILPVSGVEHLVKSGQTISSIAALYSVPKEDIVEVNRLSENATIRIGLNLIIPDGRPPAAPLQKPRPLAIGPSGIPDIDGREGGGGGFLWPTVCRRITQYFMNWRHTGLDIACSMGADVYAAEEGIVEKAWFNRGGYGNHIILEHSDGSKTLYGHLKAGGMLVSPGEYVKKGQVIGLMGSTGRSSGTHLHFEVIINGTRVNPFNRL